MNTQRLFHSFWAGLLLCSLCLSGTAAFAAPLIHIVGAGQNTIKVVMAAPMGSTSRAQDMQRAIAANLKILPILTLIDEHGVPGGATTSGATAQGIDFKRFLLAGAHLLITSNWTDSGSVELRGFDVAEGKFLFGNRYTVASGSDALGDIADTFCGDFLESIIGRGDLFRSTLAFIKSDGPMKKDVWAAKVNGRYLRKLTNIQGEALSPTWSPDGRFVLFSHIDKRSHGLGVHDNTTRTVQRIKFPGNTVIGPVFLPDNRVAVSLTDGRNPSIFLLNHSFAKERPLEASNAIDVSPSVDATGSKMVFTSSRLGSPQIFLKDLRSGAVRRVSMNGSYNTDPSISKDGTLVAFARQMGGGHRIFVYDLLSNQERQVTFGPGSDETPEFCADNYFIAYTSTRGGSKQIYLTTRSGGGPTPLPIGPGDAFFPSWGPSK